MTGDGARRLGTLARRAVRSRAVVVLFLVGVVGVAGGVAATRHFDRERALGLLWRGRDRAPAEVIALADRALALAPGLEPAHAQRALARAQTGDLAAAEADLDAAGEIGLILLDAKAWILFRGGHEEDAIALLEGSHWSDQANAAHFHEAVGTEELPWVTDSGGGRHDSRPHYWDDAPWPSERRGTSEAFTKQLDRVISKLPGTLEAHASLCARARLRFYVDLDDAAAARDVAAALAAPPRERALGLALAAEIAAVGSGESARGDPAPTSPWRRALPALERRIMFQASVDLERHACFEDEAALARAERRARRWSLAAADVRALSLLVRALVRHPESHARELEALIPELQFRLPEEATRIRIAIGPGSAERDFPRSFVPADSVNGAKALALVRRRPDVALHELGFVVSDLGPGEAELSIQALERCFVGCPREARAALVELGRCHSFTHAGELVRATAKEGPLEALVLLAEEDVFDPARGDRALAAALLSEIELDLAGVLRAVASTHGTGSAAAVERLAKQSVEPD